MLRMELVVHPNVQQSVRDELNQFGIRYHELEFFSATPVEQVVLILDSIPWEPLFGVIGVWVGRRSSRKVDIVFSDGSKINANGLSQSELKELLSEHQQRSIQFYDLSDVTRRKDVE
ncbi:hypothetical protein [Photobacterium halotolerans]|uniref:hypothetical protein n=1 Tax=Photobacterium halotolerans TaxID=265726 RepID=UPI001372A193|nr:hypothetical protein [Photobacterium halotolerans]NAW88784.1 hypothetical protein [Photobacterium halotolerans]